MDLLNRFTKSFVEKSQTVLGENLARIYLHGSAAMGCFNEKKSDIDLVIVVNKTISAGEKRRYMDLMMEMNGYAPPKGIEMSVVRREVCRPFVYPTPYELHFSNAYLEWYKTDPVDYIDRMTGVDRDLAAHFTIIRCRGERLCGEEISEVFGEVDAAYYFDSIWYDVENAKEEIVKNPTYTVLNLCRVLAYKKEALVLSKREGGDWGIAHLPQEYQGLVLQALRDYTSDQPLERKEEGLRDFAVYMLDRIRE